MKKEKILNFVNKIDNLINHKPSDIKKNPFGFFYNFLLMALIVQSIFVQLLVKEHDPHNWILILSETLVLAIFLWDFFIRYFAYLQRSSRSGSSNKHKHLTFFSNAISIIQIISIGISIFYILDSAFIHLHKNRDYLLFLNVFQALRILIIFRFTYFTRLFLRVFKKQKSLIIGWFIYIICLIFLFGVIFYVVMENDKNIPQPYSLWTCFYYAAIVITTIGLGDINSHGNVFGQVITVIFGFAGGISYGLLTSIIFSGLVMELRIESEKHQNKEISQIKKQVTKIEKETNVLAEIVTDDSDDTKDMQKDLEKLKKMIDSNNNSNSNKTK